MKEEKLGWLPYSVGWLSFVPILGIFFSLIAIMWGLSSMKEGAKKLTLIGLIGFLYSIIVFGLVLYLEYQKQGG